MMMDGLLGAMLARYHNTSVRTKLLISYLLLISIIMNVFMTYVSNASDKYTMHNAKSALNGMAAKAEAMIALKLDQIEKMLNMCAFQDDMQTVYRNRFRSKYELYLALKNTGVPYLKNAKAFLIDDVEELYVYSTTGLQNKGDVFKPFSSAEKETWYEQALLSSGTRWMLEKEKLYALLRIDSVSDGLGMDHYGVLYLKMDFEYFVENFIKIKWSRYTVKIENGNGEVCYYDEIGGALSRTELEDAIFVLFSVDKADMHVTYMIPRSAITISGDKLFDFGKLLVLLGLCIMGSVIWIYSANIFKRILRLKQSMLLVREGNMNVPAQSDYGDEIGILTNTFADMLLKIRELIDRVKENEKQAGALELKALRAQIDPHFLYNSLSYINWLAFVNENEDISYAVLQLSKFYRTCLNEGCEFILVSREISNVRAYLELQVLMHSGSFDVEYDIDEAVYEYKMLCFLLQPIAENAVLHGVDKLTGERGKIIVRARTQAAKLIFEIENNGPIETEEVEQLNLFKSKGYGISNIVQRIHLCYDDSFGLAFTAPEKGGLIVKVTLPTEPPAEKT